MPLSMRRSFAIGIAILAAGGALFMEACVGDEPSPDVFDGGGDTATDTSTATDGSSPEDTGADAGTVYAASLADQTLWERADVASLASAGFEGGAFDGRYVYYIPNSHATLLRYDTEAAFTNVNSWDAHDLAAYGVQLGGAIYASPYLYLIPATGTNDGTLVRFDTTADFKTPGSYTAFDLKNVDAQDHGFGPGAYDGKHAYLGLLSGAKAARFDTTGPFDASASYQSVSINTNGDYYSGSCFDGSHVYFVPSATSTGKPFGLLKQYATTASFTTPASFLGYDPSGDGGVDPKASSFNGCLFDGRFLYLEPYGVNSPNPPGFASLALRFDTTASFTSPDSYSKFDVKGVDANAHGFRGATFDGRYLYFAPYATSTAVRYDTTGSFGDKAAWQSYDLTTSLTAAAHGYAGAVFDGEYVYLVPFTTTLAVRFKAKTPPSLPTFPSSFY